MNNKIFLITSVLLFFTCCTSVKTIVVDIERPAQIILPNNIENIGIVNNAIPQPESLGHINYKYTRNGKRVDEKVNVTSDSTRYFFTEALFEKLSELDKFSNVSFYEFPLKEDTISTKVIPLDINTIQNLSKTLNVDAIISLDHLQINTTYHEEPYNFDYTAKFLDVKMDLIFSIYSKDGNQIFTPLHFSDSIYWDTISTSNNKMRLSSDSIPNRDEAVKLAAIYASTEVSKAFAPIWTNQARTYYGDIKEANKEADKNNWGDALKIWLNSYNTEQKTKKKARLANNIAIAYELSDNIKNALVWSQNSIKLFTESIETSMDRNNLYIAKLYHEELISRYKDFQIFDKIKQ